MPTTLVLKMCEPPFQTSEDWQPGKDGSTAALQADLATCESAASFCGDALCSLQEPSGSSLNLHLHGTADIDTYSFAGDHESSPRSQQTDAASSELEVQPDLSICSAPTDGPGARAPIAWDSRGSLETPREAALRRKREAADREFVRVAEATINHVSTNSVRRRPTRLDGSCADASGSFGSWQTPELDRTGTSSSLSSWVTPPRRLSPHRSNHALQRSSPSCSAADDFHRRQRAEAASPCSPSSLSLAWELPEARETPREAAVRRRREAADRDLAKLKRQSAVGQAVEAREIASRLRDAHSRAFTTPFATGTALDSGQSARSLPTSELPARSVLTLGQSSEASGFQCSYGQCGQSQLFSDPALSISDPRSTFWDTSDLDVYDRW